MGYIYLLGILTEGKNVVKGDLHLNSGQWEMFKQWISLCKNDAKYIVVTGSSFCVLWCCFIFF